MDTMSGSIHAIKDEVSTRATSTVRIFDIKRCVHLVAKARLAQNLTCSVCDAPSLWCKNVLAERCLPDAIAGLGGNEEGAGKPSGSL